MPSPNRLSVAYAQGTRRLLIDADVVDKMIIFRAEGRIEIDLVIERAEEGFKGILVLLFLLLLFSSCSTSAFSPALD